MAQSVSPPDAGTTPDTRSLTRTRVELAADAISRALRGGTASTAEIEQLGAEYRHACADSRPDQNWWTGWADAAARDAAADGRAR
jgi:hypothetical protein